MLSLCGWWQDIVRYIVRHFGPAAFKEGGDFWEMFREEKKFEEKTVEEVMKMDLIRLNPFVPVVQGYSAFAAVEVMAREPGVRRVPVIDNRKDRKLLNLVSTHSTASLSHGLPSTHPSHPPSTPCAAHGCVPCLPVLFPLSAQITQSQCVRWLAKHVSLLGAKQKQPVALIAVHSLFTSTSTIPRVAHDNCITSCDICAHGFTPLPLC